MCVCVCVCVSVALFAAVTLTSMHVYGIYCYTVVNFLWQGELKEYNFLYFICFYQDDMLNGKLQLSMKTVCQVTV